MPTVDHYRSPLIAIVTSHGEAIISTRRHNPLIATHCDITPVRQAISDYCTSLTVSQSAPRLTDGPCRWVYQGGQFAKGRTFKSDMQDNSHSPKHVDIYWSLR